MAAGSDNVTMAAIAERAGVSKATVSRALAGSSLIGQGVRAEVEKAAREMGYVRRSVKRHGERSILTVKLVLPPEGNRTARLFYSLNDLVEGIRSGLKPAGVNLIVENAGAEFQPFPHKKGGEVEAFVFAFHRPSASVLGEIEKAGSRAVILNRVASGVPQVVSYHADAMAQIAGHLSDLGVTGDCCFVGYGGIDDVLKPRREGFAKACEVRGISFSLSDDVWMLDLPESLNAEELKARYESGTRTFVGVNDVIGSLLVQHAREADLRVPQDVRVTGCDNAPIRGITVPLLTTVDLSMHEVAKEAGRSIYLNIVEGVERKQAIFVKGTLLTGQST
ncbi:MAG: LacI family DNA-binding transcriptional regulator [Akkermansiaceae bacterium]